MVFGVYTSAPASARQPVTFAPLAMTEREAIALTHHILSKRFEEAKSKFRAGSAKKADPQQRKRKRITVEEVRARLASRE